MRTSLIDRLEHPIVQAPLGGGPSTPALAAAVLKAGGLGFLAAGYKPPDVVRSDIAKLRRLSGRPFGVNLFAPPGPPAEPAELERYRVELDVESKRYRVDLGEPHHDDDGYETKLALVIEERVAGVSFTFGCPGKDEISLLHDAGAEAWVTVTTPHEATVATEAGADALVVQGVEAGGHRGSFDPGKPGDLGLLALLQLVQDATNLPLIATGGIATGHGIAAVLAAGASAAQLGTAFMLTAEAGTSAGHREALEGAGATAITRAFTGRPARGIENRFMREHGDRAPHGYPEVHYVTAPLRAAARERGDADGLHLWAGQAHPLAKAGPAGKLVQELARTAEDALGAATIRLSA